MKSPFSAGYLPSNRWSFDHHVAKKPSVWGEIIARPHLIVAAVGTIALVGLSGTAIWMALPDAQPQMAVAVAKAKSAPAAEPDAANLVAPEPQPKPVEKAAAPAQSVATATTPSTIATTIKPVAAKTVPLLDPANPRWVDPDGTTTEKPAEKVAAEATAQEPDSSDGNGLESAYADDSVEGTRDADATAAIPNFGKLEQDPKPDEDDATSNGRIIRSVTMRSRPSSRGGVIGTVPAKTQVQVVSCSQWCEIVYKGKRGFIYKSFMSKASR